MCGINTFSVYLVKTCQCQANACTSTPNTSTQGPNDRPQIIQGPNTSTQLGVLPHSGLLQKLPTIQTDHVADVS